MKRSEIEEKATQVLRDHGLLTVPVDPLKVAKALKIKVLNAVFSEKDKSGAIVKRGGEFSIFVNVNEPPARKRFTIAHEIGHQLLHMSLGPDAEFVDTEDNFRANDTQMEEEWDANRQKEWEANTFAAVLLMNKELVVAQWSESKDPAYLAWVFQVSTAAMTIRLKQLGLISELP